MINWSFFLRYPQYVILFPIYKRPLSVKWDIDSHIHSPIFCSLPRQIPESIIFSDDFALIESNLSFDIPQFMRLAKVMESAWIFFLLWKLKKIKKKTRLFFVIATIRTEIKHKNQTHNFGCDRRKLFILTAFLLLLGVNLKIINECRPDEVGIMNMITQKSSSWENFLLENWVIHFYFTEISFRKKSQFNFQKVFNSLERINC